jgi:antitoxin HigA-1
MSTSSSRTEDDVIWVTGEPKMRFVHPGEILHGVITEGLGLSVSEAARRLRVSRQTLHRILSGRHGVSAEMALRLGRFCGNGPDLWLRLQAAFDLARARERLKDELPLIPEPPPAEEAA